MKKMVLGVVIAAVVLYMWGFAYWGFGPYRTMILKQPADSETVGQALSEQFTENGSYFIPAFGEDSEQFERLYASGPIALVHMISLEGRSATDFSIMINGFFLNLGFILLVAVILRQVSPGIPAYADRVKFAALAGLITAVLVDGGDAVWWQIDWSWKLYTGFYHLSAWVITGAILAKFIDSQPASSAASDGNSPA